MLQNNRLSDISSAREIHAGPLLALDSLPIVFLTTVVAVLMSGDIRAGADAPLSPQPSVRISAVRARSVVMIDGILDELAWSTPPTTDFLQRDPHEGVPPTESTAVRILYDDRAMYVGIRLFDREAGKIGQRLSRRDEEPDADAVQVYLDPRHGWVIEFGANRFLVGKAIERSARKIRGFLDTVGVGGRVVGAGMQVRRGTGEVYLVSDGPVVDTVPPLVIGIVNPGNGLVWVSRAIAGGVRAVVQSDRHIEVIGDDEVLHEGVEAGIAGRGDHGPGPEKATGVLAPCVRLPMIQV